MAWHQCGLSGFPVQHSYGSAKHHGSEPRQRRDMPGPLQGRGHNVDPNRQRRGCDEDIGSPTTTHVIGRCGHWHNSINLVFYYVLHLVYGPHAERNAVFKYQNTKITSTLSLVYKGHDL